MSNQPPPDEHEGPPEPPPDGSEGPPEPPPGGLRHFFYYLPYLYQLRWVVLLVLLSTALAAALRLPFSFLPKVLTEHFGDKAYLFGYLIFVGVAVLLGAGVRLAATYLGAWLGERVVFLIRKDAFDRLERLNMLSVFSRGPGEFVQQLDRDVYTIRELLENTLTGTIVDLAQGIALLIAMFLLDPALTGAALTIFLLLSLAIRFFNIFVKKYASRARELAESITSALIECIGGFRDIQASGRFSRFAQRYQDQVGESAGVNVRTRVWSELAGLVPSLGLSGIMLGVYALGLRQDRLARRTRRDHHVHRAARPILPCRHGGLAVVDQPIDDDAQPDRPA